VKGEWADIDGAGRLKEQINATPSVFIMVPSEMHNFYTDVTHT
jgi:hypothetical protein